MKTRSNQRPIVTMTFTAILAALILLMTFTGIAYIPIGPLKLTLNALPVAVGAVVLGPMAGLLLGAVFGLSSFLTCVLGMDAFGVLLLGISPVETFLMCMVPRLLCGLLPALLYRALKKVDKNGTVSAAVACTATAVINTLLFMGALWLFFIDDIASNPQIIELLGGVIDSFPALFAAFAGVNAAVEAAGNLILGAAIVKVLFTLQKRMG